MHMGVVEGIPHVPNQFLLECTHAGAKYIV